jgi:hypothetical protein
MRGFLSIRERTRKYGVWTQRVAVGFHGFESTSFATRIALMALGQPE